jgi:acyl-CoA thioester hydrolase
MLNDIFKENFKESFEVRDCECDIQGIVNNSVYLNYLEHTRHKFLKSKNLDFAEITKKDVNLVVAKMQLNYKKSLRSGDIFDVVLSIEKQTKAKIVFKQQIIIDDLLYFEASVVVVATKSNGDIIKIPNTITEKIA